MTANIQSQTSSNEIQDYLIATIAEKTGFPQEMIESGMDLEEDLAVDSIRRVEITRSSTRAISQCAHYWA